VAGGRRPAGHPDLRAAAELRCGGAVAASGALPVRRDGADRAGDGQLATNTERREIAQSCLGGLDGANPTRS